MAELKWIINLPKDELSSFLQTHTDCIGGRPEASGCYSTIQLEGYDIVGVYRSVVDKPSDPLEVI
jgi:hypothetical protein